MFTCDYCNKEFTRADNMKRHVKTSCNGKRMKLDDGASSSNTVKCNVCDVFVEKKYYHSHLRSNVHKSNACVIVDDGVEKIAGAFSDRIISYRITLPRHFIDVEEFAHNIREKILTLLETVLNIHKSIKINFEMFGLYYLSTKEVLEIKSFNTKNKIITLGTELYEIFKKFIKEIEAKMSEFQERDSGWTLSKILYLEVNINKYNPMRASSYIDLPQQIKAKRAVINVQNRDQACFAWAITSALRQPTGLPQRTSSYPNYVTVANFSDLEYPVKLIDIEKFETKNNISVNVYGIESHFNGDVTVCEVVGPLYLTRRKKQVHINLLLISDDNGNTHYCWIKNLSRLVSFQTSLSCHERYICDGCLVHFTCETKLFRHQSEDCKKVKVQLPGNEMRVSKYGQEVLKNLLQFENFEKQLKIPFVVYADFEAILKPIDRVEPNPDTSYSMKCYEHQPYAFAYYIKCSFDDNLSKLQKYRGLNAEIEFMRRLEQDVKNIYKNNLSKVTAMNPLTQAEIEKYENAYECHICEKPIEKLNEKVCDHDHTSGVFRGAAHMTCNINFKIPKFVPVFFHNLSNYDSHLFVKTMALNNEDIDVIAQNKEKYISFSKKIHVDDIADSKGKQRQVFLKIRFLDSYRFMQCSLDKLSSYLDDDQCQEVRKHFCNDEMFKVVRKKGIFPYSFVDSFNKLDYPKFPTKEQFYNTLSDSTISDEDYRHAEYVWDLFKCRTLGDYSDIYLTSDVLLLADVFENFRNICLKDYKLDPTHYFTAPGLSWDSMLRMTRVKLELLTDIDMLYFFKYGVRGGVSMCSRRMEVANNKFLPHFDHTKPSSYIVYLDATNLYGFAMCSKLPTGNFSWVTENELKELDISSIDTENDIGYVLEVDLEYPQNLHDLHNDFPFCPENVIPPYSKFSKLIPNLCNKSKYIIHYLNLKQCLEHGLKVTKIHRAIKFNQSNWLKQYIDFNSQKRNQAKNEFEKNYYKLMNNSVFGKTMENVENRVDIKLFTHWESQHRKPGAETYVTKPNFKSSKIFSDHLVAIEMGIVQINYTKPLYVGFTVLEIAKTVIYDFFYNFIKAKYGSSASLLYTDTDSLILSIITDNVYDDIKENLNKFDTSNFEASNIHNIPRSISVVGKMKDEYAGQIVKSFFGTGAKAYCVELLSETVKKAKGIKKYVTNKYLSVNDYKRIVETGGVIFKQQYVFRSDFHTMFTELTNKIALSGKDDKRYILNGKYNTLAWGHYKIEELENDKKLDELVALIQEENI